jgi:hypothetical protein
MLPLLSNYSKSGIEEVLKTISMDEDGDVVMVGGALMGCP